MKNELVIKIFRSIAQILELQEVPWKPQAYQKVVRVIEGLTEDVEDIYHREGLPGILNLPGVGENLGKKIEEIILTGKLEYYNKLKKEVKIDIDELSSIPTLGPKKIKFLYAKLNIKNAEDLKKAILQQKLRELPGFGAETEKKLLEGIAFIRSKPKRFLYAQALPIVRELNSTLKSLEGVDQVEVAGSFRRGQETIGDLDFLIISKKQEIVMKHFTSLPMVKEIIAHGLTKSSIRLGNGMQVDLRVVKKKELGSALNYFIGSKAHNVELRKLALKKGFTLSEYGLFRHTTPKRWVAGRTEEEIYHKLKMQYIPPELRENTGEIAAALQHHLPKLVTVKDMNGLFHTHTLWSDGTSSILEMTKKAELLRMKFISFADHYSTMGVTNPLNEKKLDQYLKEIEHVQKTSRIKIFSGAEIDINKDGDLVIPRHRLKDLDVVIASVHSSLQMREEEMTSRIMKCLKNWDIDILGHPTNRLIQERPPIQANLDHIFQEAKDKGIFLEINTQPSRLDLNGQNIKKAGEFGCRFTISPDAHSLQGLETFPLGILQARRGWLEKKDLVNSWNISKIEKEFS